MPTSSELPGSVSPGPSNLRGPLGKLILAWLLLILSLPVFAGGVWYGWTALVSPTEELEPYKRAKQRIVQNAASLPVEEQLPTIREQETQLVAKLSGYRTMEVFKAVGILLGAAMLLSYGNELRKKKPEESPS